MSIARNLPLHARLATMLALCAGPACAALPLDGALDPSFPVSGKRPIPFQAMDSTAADAVVDGFGRTYLVGSVATGSGVRIGITRLRKDGTTDLGYGPQDVGLVVAPEQPGFDILGTAAALDAQGHLLVGGTLSQNGQSDAFGLCRFDIDGNLATFPNGFQCIRIAFEVFGSSQSADLHDLVVQPDGKIVLAGEVHYSAATTHFVVARLDATGDLDTSFNGTGKVSHAMAGSAGSRANSAAIARNGKIVLGGEVTLSGRPDSDLLLVRLMPNGSLDGDFGTNGFATFAPVQNTRDQAIEKIALLPGDPQLLLDQAIVAAGSIGTAPGSNLTHGLIARINADGKSLTPGFGGGPGYRVDDTGHSLEFNDIALEADGRIAVVGTITAFGTPTASPTFYVTRFLPGGTQDTAFNAPHGFTTIDVGLSGTGAVGGDHAGAIALQNGRILVAGHSLASANPLEVDFSVAALVRDRIFGDGFD